MYLKEWMVAMRDYIVTLWGLDPGFDGLHRDPFGD